MGSIAASETVVVKNMARELFHFSYFILIAPRDTNVGFGPIYPQWAGTRPGCEVCLWTGTDRFTRGWNPDVRGDDRLLYARQTAWERSRNLIRSAEAHDPTWMRRQIKTRATRKSWYNRFGAMMTSPLTIMKGDDCTAF